MRLLVIIYIMKKNKYSFSKEVLHHFQCGLCQKWWTIGDLPALSADRQAARQVHREIRRYGTVRGAVKNRPRSMLQCAKYE